MQCSLAFVRVLAFCSVVVDPETTVSLNQLSHRACLVVAYSIVSLLFAHIASADAQAAASGQKRPLSGGAP